MSADLLFATCNAVVVPAWLLLICAPGWTWATRLVCPVVVPSLLAVTYAGLLVSQVGELDGGFTSLSEVARLFENRFALLAGWVHYLAFDLFIGSWEVRDARRAGLRHLVVVPCLLLTFLVGPLGLFVYLLIRRHQAKESHHHIRSGRDTTVV